MSQIGLPFDWTGPGNLDAFLPGECNAQALSHIEMWRVWPVPVSALSGPPRSGRSLLAQRFARLSGGTVIDPAQGIADEILFHAWNRALDSGVPLLLVGHAAPAEWTVRLPDLASRLAAVPHVRIAEPDDALVEVLVGTGLARAGTAFAPDVPGWIARRVERSYAAVAAVLDLLNRSSVSSSRKISVPYAKDILEKAGFLPILFDDRNIPGQEE